MRLQSQAMFLSKRIGPPSAVHRASRRLGRFASSATAVQVKEWTPDTGIEAEEAFGNAYGAGPSRLPYVAAFPSTVQEPPIAPPVLPARRTVRTPSIALANKTARTSGPANRRPPVNPRRPRIIKYRLAGDELAVFKFLDVTPFSDWGEAITNSFLALDPSNLSRLQLHRLLHGLARQPRHRYVAALLLKWRLLEVKAAAGIGPLTDHAGGLRLHLKTLAYIFRPDQAIKFRDKIPQLGSEIPLFDSVFDRPFTLAEQASKKPFGRHAALLDVLDLLRDTRHPRPLELYHGLLSDLVMAKMPDEAAKVYVGLVEEWITEGRLAYGAEPQDVDGIGAPPADPLLRARREAHLGVLRSWWQGIRSWALPGEVLSPHQRLNLWHPRHSSLRERLRNFPIPIPQSPPLVVPPPYTVLLRIVLQGIMFDAQNLPPARFAASMRACAILSNTVLTRILPVLSKGEVFDILARSPRYPPVYPDGMTELPPVRDRWAYQASTHVHIALKSVLWTPPTSAGVYEYLTECEEAAATGRKPPPPPFTAYGLPALCRESCLVLVRYVLRRLRDPKSLTNLLSYIRDKFQKTAAQNEGFFTSLFTTIARESRIVRDHSLAAEAEGKMFAGTALDDASFESWQRETTKAVAVYLPEPARKLASNLKRAPKPWPGYKPLLDDLDPAEADDRAIVQLITRLGATGQRDRLRYVTKALIPYLAFSKHSSPADLEWFWKRQRLRPSRSRRPGPSPIPSAITGALLGALAKNGDLYTAEQVFAVARYNEWYSRQKWQAAQAAAGTTKPFPPRWCIPIEVYTAMMKVYSVAALSSAGKVEKRQLTVTRRYPKTMRLPYDAARRPRAEAASYMVWRTYVRARRVWRSNMSGPRGDPGPVRPDRRFFQQFIDSRKYLWEGLVEEKRDSTVLPIATMQLRRVARDMMQFECPVPPAVFRALRWSMGPEQQDKAWAAARKAGYRKTREEWVAENTRDLPVWDAEEERVVFTPAEEAGWGDEETAEARRQWTLKIRNTRSVDLFGGRTARERDGGTSTRLGRRRYGRARGPAVPGPAIRQQSKQV